jgi:hypothetical protein
MKTYRIFLVGSFRQPEPDSFRSAAGKLAKALAPHAREFILCSTAESTLDWHAMLALKPMSPPQKIRLIHTRPEENEGAAPDILQLRSELLPAVLDPAEVSGGWRAAHLRALQECDVVIAMGGSERGTGTVIYSADVLGKPIVLVPCFGGAAKGAWRDFGRNYLDEERNQLRGSLEAADWAENIAAAAVSIANRNPFAKSAPNSFPLLVLATTAVMAWGLVQWDLGRGAPLLPLVAGLLGGLFLAGLMGLTVAERARPTSLRLPDIGILLTTALLIGFSTLMFNELLSFLVLGRTTLFDMSTSDAHGYFLRLSLVSFLAGTTAKKYFDALARRAISTLS